MLPMKWRNGWIWAPMIAICSYRMFGISLAFHQIGQGLSEIGSDLQKIGLRLAVNQHWIGRYLGSGARWTECLLLTYVTGLGLAQDWHVQCQCPVIWCQSSVIPIIWVGCSWLACLGADQWWIGISSCNLVIGRAFVVWHWISIDWLRCGTGSGLLQKPHWHWIGQGSASGWISTGNQLEAGCWPLVWWSLD